ncbi:helix-turn-helix transcriptional regulator [Pedobacter agri]|uniref:helix-turn-helix domain-containing protein n=1 Tax=Pedobacter agri TaxID=454586 RepID=UPI00292CD567|nr:helix-turn-helix transcriptional regulator [Pedobacter agri]
MTTLGTKLARLRTKKGFTQQEVADSLNVSQPAYHKWETDASKPATEKLIKICELYEIELSELIEDTLTLNFSNKDCSIQNMGNHNTTYYNESPDLIKGILKNQDAITSLLDTQNKLIQALIVKIAE